MDAELFRRLYGDGHGLTYVLMIGLSAIGSGWSMLGLPPFLWMRRTRGVALGLTIALVVVAIAVFTLKAIVARQRPCACIPGVHALYFTAPTDGSFPSGHAAGSFCFATYLAVRAFQSDWSRRAKIGLAVVLGLFAAGVSISRVYLGVHYPFDIAAGALLGSLIGAAFALRYRPGPVQTPQA